MSFTLKIVYIIGGIHSANGMSDVMTRKVNWLARHTDAELYVVLTERPDLKPFYELEPSVRVVNLDLNFDRLDTLPLWRKLLLYRRLQRRYRRLLTAYLVDLHADIVVSALRRDINFLCTIPDGSRKVGELHFARSSYRVFSRPGFPAWLCSAITRRWQGSLIQLLKRLDAFVVLSHEDAAAWPELKDNIHVIPNSIRNLTDEQPLDPQKVYTPLPNREGQGGGSVGAVPACLSILAAGRYTSQKGFDLLLRSWALLESDFPTWHLDIFGSGDASPYQALADKLGLKNVTLHGATSDLQGEMCRSSVFVFSSRYEGFGLVLAEAMACGMAVVSYACPCGPRDIITDGVDGLLVERVGDIVAFAEAMRRLLSDASLRQRLADNARQSALRYSEDVVMAQWKQLFNLN